MMAMELLMERRADRRKHENVIFMLFIDGSLGVRS